ASRYHTLRTQVLAETGAAADMIVNERSIFDEGSSALLDPELTFNRERRHGAPHGMPPCTEEPAKLRLGWKPRTGCQLASGYILCDPIANNLPLLEAHWVPSNSFE